MAEIAEPPVKPAAEIKPAAPAAPAPAAEPIVTSVGDRLRGKMGLKKKPEAAAEPAKPAAAPVAPKKKVVAAAPAPAVKIDEEKLGAAIAKGLSKNQPAPAAPAAVAEVKKEIAELSPVNKRRLQVLEQMAKDDPTVAEVPKKFLEAIEKEKVYCTKWESENKGKKFDASDAEHEQFFSENDVEWDQDAFELAKDKIISDEASLKAESKFKPQFDAIEAEKRANAALPQILTHQATAAKLLFDDLGEEFSKVLKSNGEIDITEVTRLQTENPILKPVFKIAEQTEVFAGEMYRIANGLVKYNPALPIHKEIEAFAVNQERELKSAPAENQKNQEGKDFATAEEWSKMSPEEQATHWHFTENELTAIYSAQQAAKAKKIISEEENKFNSLAEKRGLKKVEPINGGSPTAPKVEERPLRIAPAPASPAGVVAPRVAASPNQPKAEENSIFSRLRGKK